MKHYYKYNFTVFNTVVSINLTVFRLMCSLLSLGVRVTYQLWHSILRETDRNLPSCFEIYVGAIFQPRL